MPRVNFKKLMKFEKIDMENNLKNKFPDFSWCSILINFIRRLWN